jgi:prepilin-type processing-associated H-X9-DG protein
MLCPNATNKAGDRHFGPNPAIIAKMENSSDSSQRRRLPHYRIGRDSEVVVLMDTVQWRANGTVDRDGRWMDGQFGRPYRPLTQTDNDLPIDLAAATPNEDVTSGQYKVRFRENGRSGHDGELLGNFLFADFHAETRSAETILRRNFRPDETNTTFWQ